jgi:hypothetical protein
MPKGTLKVPFQSNPELQIWKWRLLKSEVNELILANHINHPHKDIWAKIQSI